MKKPDMKGIQRDIKIAGHYLRIANQISKSYLPLLIIASVIKAISPFLNIIMPKYIIDEAIGSQRPERFVLYIGTIILGNAFFNLMNRYLEMKLDIAQFAMVNGFELHFGKHIMNLDFESMEDPEILDMKEKAIFPINNQGILWRMMGNITRLIEILITTIGLIALVATLNFLLILAIIAIVIVNAAIFKKAQALQYKFHQDLIPLNRRFNYYGGLTSDFSMAKDIRIYNMAPFILKKIDAYNSAAMSGFSKLFVTQGKYEGLSNINLQIQMILVYAYMVWQVVKESISIGDFTMYISAANSFSANVSSFITQLIEFRQMCRYLDLYLEFESLPVKSKSGTKPVNLKDTVCIEFKNVSFRYPRADQDTLKNVSIKINSGEKLSVVGHNGAGKTTFIKLLCRLYEPTEGKILVNGINVKEYSFDEYLKLLAVVFQDYKLFSFTIKENIIFDQTSNDLRLIHSLRKAGIYDKILTLEKGTETSLYKNFEKDGIEFSGGEAQKLAIARAIYKDSPIVILDEPTAALDPYAEFEIYSKFNDLVQNKTAIYISHRLSSCRFCDRIAVFDDGRLVEYGTHDELSQGEGVYSKMWHTQAQYYVA
ncbi:MAG: putative transporter [Herbinix sp.]|jgi:ATP-binding cassette subfamily B protein/ATP-binding cassette subfamily C protein|nr:putative transporter [Herbinix sp.]